jgi:hypothetical protein
VLRHHFGDGRSRRGFAMIYVADGSYVYVRFIPLKGLFCHNTVG